MSRAIVGAREALASLAFIAIEALALAGRAIANTLARALSVLVESIDSDAWNINPSNLERANTVRAIARVVGQTDTPVIVAFANIIKHTSSVTTALIVASCLNSC